MDLDELVDIRLSLLLRNQAATLRQPDAAEQRIGSAVVVAGTLVVEPRHCGVEPLVALQDPDDFRLVSRTMAACKMATGETEAAETKAIPPWLSMIWPSASKAAAEQLQHMENHNRCGQKAKAPDMRWRFRKLLLR